MMVVKTCLLISQHLVRYSYKRTRVLIMLLVGNQMGYKVLLFLRNIPIFSVFAKLFRYEMAIKFGKDLLVVKQKNCKTKIVNAYIIFELDSWPKLLH